MKFWKRWLRFLTSDEEEEGNEQRTNSRLSAGMPERGAVNVIYQYPQGRFRFPLIPDDQPGENSGKAGAGEKRGIPAAAESAPVGWRFKGNSGKTAVPPV